MPRGTPAPDPRQQTFSIEEMLPANAASASRTPAIGEQLDRIMRRRIAHSQPVFAMDESLVNAPPPQAARELIEGRTTHLSPSWAMGPAGGLPKLREEIAHWRASVYRDRITADNVLVTAGATAAFSLAMVSLLKPGDAAMVMWPCFPNYIGSIDARGGEVQRLQLRVDNNFEPSTPELSSQWKPRTRALVAVNPHNPSGTMLSSSSLAGMERHCQDNRACLIVDETFAHFDLRSDPTPSHQVSLATTISLGSFSETFSLADYRVGYMIGPAKVIAYAAEKQSCVSGRVSARDQEIALAALSQREPHLSLLLDALRMRDAQLSNTLAQIDGVEAVYGEAGTYKWVKTSRRDSQQLALDLASEVGVFVKPGTHYGQDGWIRISFGKIGSSTAFQEALRGLKNFKGWLKQPAPTDWEATLPHISAIDRRRFQLEIPQ